jgi:hypothetical protein
MFDKSETEGRFEGGSGSIAGRSGGGFIRNALKKVGF